MTARDSFFPSARDVRAQRESTGRGLSECRDDMLLLNLLTEVRGLRTSSAPVEERLGRLLDVVETLIERKMA